MTRILLIDDDTAVRETIGRSLSYAGYDLEFAKDGAEGLRLLKANKPDLVICDILMPEKEGIETIIEITKFDADIAIVAISGGGCFAKDKVGFRDDILETAKIFGAKYALRKPFRPRDLLNVVEKALPSFQRGE